ncbi:MAG: Rpn family recombination-promoting nuclease/putative transposase [Candidatus Cloacimonadota bacterium]|nr:Rpn family recombination-promoting nuclease/putative transposase [Candidatus Cloacimonadota bacterium]
MGRKLVSFDWAMKKLLRSKANFGILEGFLSELLNEDITIIQVIESEGNKETREDKYNRVDLKVIDSNKKIIIIELQFDRQFDFLQRILYGTSKAISEQIKETDPYSKVSKVISVNILYFSLGDGQDYIYCGKTIFYGLHDKSELKLSSKQKELFKAETVSDIYPEYFLLKIINFNDIAKNSLDEWIYFLKNEEIKDNFSAKGLKEAKQKLDVLKMSNSERQEYENYQKQLHQDASMYESHYVSGKMDGQKEGKIEGIKEGKIEIAKKMLKRNMSIEEIIEMTNLTKDEIEKLV